MSIITGQNAEASDFINSAEANATPASDAGRVPKLESDGKISTRFLKFGGDGSDGALAISSGTTTIDLGGAQYVVKNYTSISITGTGKLAFSNPHANGTIIILRCLGNVVLTSSTSPCIDASGMGGAGGSGGASSGAQGSTGNIGTDMLGSELVAGGGANNAVGTAGVIFSTVKTLYTKTADQLYHRHVHIYAGSGGGGGEAGQGVQAGGAGGRGGGGLYIECAGALNFTGTVSVAGLAGADGENASAGYCSAGGGGGGAAGSFLLLYNYLTANSGTVTATGGAGGRGGTSISGGDTGGGTRGNGGGGAGSYTAAGGNGGATPGSNGGPAGGAGAGGGGGGGQVIGGAQTTGGTGGSSESGLVAKNIYLT